MVEDHLLHPSFLHKFYSEGTVVFFFCSGKTHQKLLNGQGSPYLPQIWDGPHLCSFGDGVLILYSYGDPIHIGRDPHIYRMGIPISM